MKSTAIRILTLAFSLSLLLGILPLSVVAEYELWDGSARTFKLKAGEERFFLYTATETGIHTVERQSSVFTITFDLMDTSLKDAFPENVQISGKANPNDESFRLTAGVQYVVHIRMFSGHTEWPDGFEDTLTIRPGEPVKETDLATPFPTGGELKITVKPGEEFKYKFTPSQSGRYVLYGSNTVIDVRLRHGPESLDMPDNQMMIANPFGVAHGYMADMTAGETYIITFSMWENHPDKAGFTDTYRLEKVENMKSAELRSAFDHTVTDLHGYVGGSIQLFPYTDPIYFEAYTTAWTVSDPSVARFITEDSKQTRELELLKAGTVTVTATVDGQAVSQTITVKERPALELNKTVTLTFGGSLGAQCAFTPSESGTYRFAMTGGGGTTVIKDTNYATYWEGSGSLTASLKAGKTYILEGAFGPKNYTVRVTKGSASDPTDPAPPSGDEPTESTTDVTVPTDTPTDPSQSAQGSTPSTDISLPDSPVQALPLLPQADGKGYVSHDTVAQILENSNRVTITADSEELTAVVIPTETLAATAEADATLQVVLADATVTLNAKALAKIAAQTDGATVELAATAVTDTDLNAAQRDTLKKERSATVVRLLLTADDKEIHDFGNGTVTVAMAITPQKKASLKDYTVYYLKEDGSLTKMSTSVKDGVLVFETDHFSDYVALYRPGNKTPDTLNVGRIVIYSLIALLLLIGGGIAIYFISKRETK